VSHADPFFAMDLLASGVASYGGRLPISLAGLGSWPGDPRYEGAIDPIRLRIEVLDAVAVMVQDPGVSARARDLADQALAEGRYERVSDRPAVMPNGPSRP